MHSNHLKGQVSISPAGEDPEPLNRRGRGFCLRMLGNHKPGLTACATGLWRHQEAGPFLSPPESRLLRESCWCGDSDLSNVSSAYPGWVDLLTVRPYPVWSVATPKGQAREIVGKGLKLSRIPAQQGAMEKSPVWGEGAETFLPLGLGSIL